MRIITETKNLNTLDNKVITESAQGKWYHVYRVYILEADDKYVAVSLHIFERIAAFFYHLFHQNYFSKALNYKNVKVLDPCLLSPESKKAAAIGSKAEVAATPALEQRMNEIREKETEALGNLISNLLAYEMLYTNLEQPPKKVELDRLIEASTFLENYIQKNATGDSIDLNTDHFSTHAHLNHFGTLIAVLRRLVAGSKVYGYEIDTAKSVVKIALNDHSDLVHKESFVTKDILINTTIKPTLKEMAELFKTEKTKKVDTDDAAATEQEEKEEVHDH